MGLLFLREGTALPTQGRPRRRPQGPFLDRGEERGPRSGVRSYLRDGLKFLLVIAVVCGIVLAILRIFFVDLAVVGHDGMAPTLETGQEVFVWKDAAVDLGDIVICQHPRNESEFVLARMVAKGGDTIDSIRGQLRINGRIPDVNVGAIETFSSSEGRLLRLARNKITLGQVRHEFYARPGRDFSIPERVVPENRIFLLGDNRGEAGRDSRSFGPVDPTQCLGVVFMRWSVREGSTNRTGDALDLL